MSLEALRQSAGQGKGIYSRGEEAMLTTSSSTVKVKEAPRRERRGSALASATASGPSSGSISTAGASRTALPDGGRPSKPLGISANAAWDGKAHRREGH